MPFACAICEEESTRICARCTKDTCRNHLCERCFRCSDCCECEVMLEEKVHEPARSALRSALPRPEPGPGPDPQPEPHEPPPGPDPLPPDEPDLGPIAP